jgi:hypothetical protein
MIAARILLIVPVIVAFLGFQDILVYLTNLKPLELSVEDLVTNRPKAKWLRLTGAQMNTIETISVLDAFSKKTKEVYIPIRPKNKDQESTTSVLLVSTDPKLLSLADKFLVADESPEKHLEGMNALQTFERLALEIPIEGLVEFGIEQDDRKDFELRKKIPYLSKNPIIIEGGEKPSLSRGLTIILVAIPMFFVIWIGTAKSRKSQPPPLPYRFTEEPTI